MSQNQDGVVDLVDAGVPADQGLSALGLLMQLAGSVTGAVGALVGFMALFAGGTGDIKMWMLLILAMCVARSMVHRAAGTEILYGRKQLAETPTNPLLGVHRYVLVGIAQSVLMAAIMAWKFELPVPLAAIIGTGLAIWPLTLGVLVRLPRFTRFATTIPQSEDKSFESTAILMTILGTVGVLATGTILLLMFSMPGAMLAQGPIVLLMITLGLLIVRSGMHVQAGLSGLRETSVDRAVELSNRYANFGVISAFCGAGAMLLVAMTTRLDMSGLVMVVGLCWMLMAWPLIIRRFYSERQFSDLLAGDDAPIHRRSPDAGLTGLGWLLIALAALNATFVVPQLLLSFMSHGDREFRELFAMAGGAGGRSVWFSVGLIVLQVWAGFELVRMSAHHRIIANIYAAISAVVGIYMLLPTLESLKGSSMIRGPEAGVALGPLALALVVPFATLVLVNRKLSPTARARFRPRATPVTPTSDPASANVPPPPDSATPSA